MAAEREIKTVLTLDDASFSRGLKAATSNVAAIRAEMNASIKKADGLGKGFKKWSASVSGLNKVLKAERQQMKVLNKEYQAQKKALAEAIKEMEKARKEHGEDSEEVKKASNAYAALAAKVNELRKQMALLEQQEEDDEDQLKEKVESPLKKVGQTLGAVAIGFTTLAVTAGAALIKLSGQAQESANELKQNLAANETEFGVWSKLLQQEADKAWENLGLSKSAYLAAANDIGAFLQEAGAPVQQSAEISAQVLEMAASLSSEYGVPIEQVLSDIKEAANGSRTAMNRYGIQVTGTTVQQTALKYGVTKTYEEMTEEEKKLWAVKTALEQGKDAQAKYTAETNNTTQASKELTAAWENFLSGAGSAEDVGKAAGNLVSTWAEKIVTGGPKMVQSAIQMAGTFLNSFLMTFSATWKSKIWPAIQEFFKATFGVDLPDWNTVKEEIIQGWNTVTSAVTTAYNLVVQVVQPVWDTVRSAVETGWGVVKNAAVTAYDLFVNTVLPAWETVKSAVETGWGVVTSAAVSAFNLVVSAVQPVWNTVKAEVEQGWNLVKGLAGAVFELIVKVGQPVWDSIKTAVENGWQIVKSAAVSAFELVVKVAQPVWNTIKTAVENGWQIVKSAAVAAFELTVAVVQPVWNTIKAAIEAGWEIVKGLTDPNFNLKVNVVQPIWEFIKTSVENGWKLVTGVSDAVCKFLVEVSQPVWSNIKTAVENGWNIVTSITDTVMDFVVDVSQPVWSTVKSAVENGWKLVQNVGSTVFFLAVQVTEPVWSTVQTAVSTGWASVTGAVSDFFLNFGIQLPDWDSIKTTVSNKWAEITGVVSDFFVSLGIKIPTWDEIAEDWNTFWSNVHDHLPGWLQDILNFFGLGGGGSTVTAGSTALNEAANKLAGTVGNVSGSLSSLSTSFDGAASKIAQFAGESGTQHTGSGGKFAGGAWNVPFDNYLAALHRGEMVLTADQARRYRAQAASGGNTYNDSASIYIDKYNQYSGADADALLQQMQMMQRRQRMGYGLA